jgi:hypothetical protein
LNIDVTEVAFAGEFFHQFDQGLPSVEIFFSRRSGFERVDEFRPSVNP